MIVMIGFAKFTFPGLVTLVFSRFFAFVLLLQIFTEFVIIYLMLLFRRLLSMNNKKVWDVVVLGGGLRSRCAFSRSYFGCKKGKRQNFVGYGTDTQRLKEESRRLS